MIPSRPADSSHPTYRLVIFDMDGTLTEELLDFPAIRRDIGLPAAGGILEQIAAMDADRQRQAHAILHRHEMAAADACALRDGATELLADLAARGLRTALLTRNSAACADRILTRHRLALDHVATREHLPHKPHPDSILNIVRSLTAEPTQTLMVGDYLYDLQAAAAAGVDSALLCPEGHWPDFAAQATYRIRRLRDILTLIDTGAIP